MSDGHGNGSSGDQRTDLDKLDKLLDDWNSDLSEVAAFLVLRVWRSSQADGTRQLILQRAERWRGKYEFDIALGRPAHATGEELMRLLFGREERQAMAMLARERMRKEGRLVPSVRYRTPLEPIEDHEVESFMQLLDREGFLRLFDPANRIVDDTVQIGSFAVLDRLRWSYQDLLSLYLAEPARPWDPMRRDPSDAMLIDWVLVSARQQAKWTWVTSDRCFCRLPWGHPLKSVGGDRPGWVWSREVLEEIGLIRHTRRKTWRLTPQARACVDTQIVPLWKQWRAG